MTKNLKEKWKEFYGLYGDIGRTEDDILLFIETLLQEQKEELYRDNLVLESFKCGKHGKIRPEPVCPKCKRYNWNKSK